MILLYVEISEAVFLIVGSEGPLLAKRGEVCQEDQQSSSLLVPSLPKAKLFVYDLDLLIDHLPGKPVDRDMDPVVLLAFNDEIVWKTGSIWLVVP